VAGAPGAGALPLSLRVAPASEPVDSLVLLLSDGAAAEEIEIARMPLAGAAIAPALFIERDTAWLLAGSVLAGDPLHRAVGVRRGALRRGEAQLHNLHGLADSAASDLDAAQREFARAIAADATFVDALYNAAAAAAREKREEEAVAFLRRASALDPDRVQVLGRSDDDLASLRRRADVRALLGQRRLPPEGVPPPP
jgi:tetratricopeptide (TPR) repeat protein